MEKWQMTEEFFLENSQHFSLGDVVERLVSPIVSTTEGSRDGGALGKDSDKGCSFGFECLDFIEDSRIDYLGDFVSDFGQRVFSNGQSDNVTVIVNTEIDASLAVMVEHCGQRFQAFVELRKADFKFQGFIFTAKVHNQFPISSADDG